MCVGALVAAQRFRGSPCCLSKWPCDYLVLLCSKSFPPDRETGHVREDEQLGVGESQEGVTDRDGALGEQGRTTATECCRVDLWVATWTSSNRVSPTRYTFNWRGHLSVSRTAGGDARQHNFNLGWPHSGGCVVDSHGVFASLRRPSTPVRMSMGSLVTRRRRNFDRQRRKSHTCGHQCVTLRCAGGVLSWTGFEQVVTLC